ncbi:MAG: hypothetical protein AB1896_20220, partial [Thermodesulfobacteriota bacterium]
MGRMNLKIKHKVLLLILVLVALVSASIIVTTILLSNRGRDTVLAGVTEKLDGLQKASLDQFTRFTKLSEEGIQRASGLVIINEIIKVAQDNQQEFTQVVQQEIKTVSGDVAGILAAQGKVIGQGLDELLAVSTDSINAVMAFDNNSADVLANVAVFNVDSLKTSNLDSLRRFGLLIKSVEGRLQGMHDQNSEALDAILVELVNRLEDPNFEPGRVTEF